MTHGNIQHILKEGRTWIVVGFIFICGALGYTFIRTVMLDNRIAALSADLASTTAVLALNVSTLHTQTEDISQTLTHTKQDVAAVSNNVNAVQSQVGGVAQTVGTISTSVSTLQKLSTIDPELLKKYSKVYFLNENYTPSHLTAIPQEDVYSNTKSENFLTEALPFMLNMVAAAKASGVTLYVESAYRSFATQQSLKSEYTVTYGAGTANSFSADQGYSEHQLGTAADFVTAGSGGQLTTAFDTTSAYIWLTQNAYKYGFELSYPKGNTYYIYEPWHWRYVGVKLATDLHNTNKNFYDMDQRDIDAYLVTLFD